MSKTITCTDIDGQKYEIDIADLEWRPSVYGVVIKGNKILLSRQFGDRYDLPGGGLELGETPEEGVIREVKEETGIDVEKPQFLGIENSFFQGSHADNKSYHSLMLYYICEYVGGKISTVGFDEWEKKYAEMAEWIPLEKLNDLKIASTVDYRPYVKKALS